MVNQHLFRYDTRSWYIPTYYILKYLIYIDPQEEALGIYFRPQRPVVSTKSNVRLCLLQISQNITIYEVM